MRVFSIFNSISGEVGHWPQGTFTTFIRLAGCNLRCSYCDTEKALLETACDMNIGATSPISNKMDIDSIVTAVNKIGCPQILITGGEPLTQKEELQKLVTVLKNNGYLVSIETNGSIPCDIQNVYGWVVDYKTPSSNMTNHMMSEKDFNNLPFNSFVKFVCSDEEDVLFALEKAAALPKHLFISFSANPNSFSHARLVEMLQERNKYRYIINYQIHKAIWPDTKKEV